MMRKHIFCGLAALLFSLLLAAPVGAEMIEEVVFGLFLDAPCEEAADDYYINHHALETIRISGPWLRWHDIMGTGERVLVHRF